MIGQIRRHLIIGSLISAFGLTGCVSQGKYDDLQARYEQLQAQNQQLEYQIARLRGAIKYHGQQRSAVPIRWLGDECTREAGHRQNGIETRSDAAEQNHGQRLHRQRPDRSKVAAGGYHLERDPVAKARRKRHGVSHCARPRSGSGRGARVWRCSASRVERYSEGPSSKSARGTDRGPRHWKPLRLAAPV